MSALFLTVLAAGRVPVPHTHGGEPCASCDPDDLLDEVERTLERVTRWELAATEPGNPPAEPALLSALEAAEIGSGDAAKRLAREAAARCFLRGEQFCGEALPLLAALMIAEEPEDPDVRAEALALMALAPWESLSSQTCQRGTLLRFRLAELTGPRVARAGWADACGPLGRVGELGYRAAKAAILRGELADAERRLHHARVAGASHVVRSSYLLAVLRVAEGRLDDAERLFGEVLALPPEARRTEEEDDARILAALQLARLARERGENEEALDLYRAVPVGRVGRDQALLEGAVVAAGLGDLGAARLYLDALPLYRPDVRQELEVYRLRASLAVIDGDEAEARATFAELTRIGEEVRREWLAPTTDPLEALKRDPSLGGLLDAADGRRLLALDASLDDMAERVAGGRAEVALIRQGIAEGKLGGSLDDALLELEAADALLRRAAGQVGARPGPRVAGPAEAAFEGARRLSRLRRDLDGALEEVRSARERRRRLLELRLAEIEAELDEEAVRLDVLTEAGRREVRELAGTLFARASDVATNLEMSADVGDIELAYRKKGLATLAVDRARREYEEEKRVLARDNAGRLEPDD